MSYIWFSPQSGTLERKSKDAFIVPKFGADYSASFKRRHDVTASKPNSVFLQFYEVDLVLENVAKPTNIDRNIRKQNRT